ncbi:MAG: hypothetical protein U0T74_15455 [Chitinophagales bacterium]
MGKSKYRGRCHWCKHRELTGANGTNGATGAAGVTGATGATGQDGQSELYATTSSSSIILAPVPKH